MAKRITIIYGTTTGATERVATMIRDRLGPGVGLFDIYEAALAEFEQADVLLLGVPTWNIGELQHDWENLLPRLGRLDLTGKKIALFGLGDAYGYPDNFLDALGLLWKEIKGLGSPELVGVWPTDGYDFTGSLGLHDEDHFLGLGLDDDNEPELHEARIDTWLKKVRAECGLPAALRWAAE